MPKFIAKQLESHLTEAEAIGQAKDGAADAFEYLYKAHNGRVYGVCLRMTQNPAEAEDLTQQTFLQVFRKIETFRGEPGFLNLAASSDCKHCLDASSPQETG